MHFEFGADLLDATKCLPEKDQGAQNQNIYSSLNSNNF